jgi:hypothetical protein
MQNLLILPDNGGYQVGCGSFNHGGRGDAVAGSEPSGRESSDENGQQNEGEYEEMEDRPVLPAEYGNGGRP